MCIQSRADKLEARAYDMFYGSQDDSQGEPFSMFSKDRGGRVFWDTLIQSMLEKGLTDKEAIVLLQSKQMRWMLDNPSLEYEKAVRDMVTDSMIKFAREEAKNPS